MTSPESAGAVENAEKSAIDSAEPVSAESVENSTEAGETAAENSTDTTEAIENAVETAAKSAGEIAENSAVEAIDSSEPVSAESVEDSTEAGETAAENSTDTTEAIESAAETTVKSISKKSADSVKTAESGTLAAFFAFIFGCCAGAARSVRRHMRLILPRLGGFLSGIGRAAAGTAKTLAISVIKALRTGVIIFFRGVRRDARAILPALGGMLGRAGGCAWRVLSATVRAVFGFVKRLFGAVFGTIGNWLKKKFKQPLYDLWCAILTPFAHAYGAADLAAKRFSAARKKGFWSAVGSAFEAFWQFLGGCGEVLRFIFNYAAPVVSIIFLISLVRYASTLQYAITVEYNGSELATIENEAAYNEAQTLMQDKVTFTDEEQSLLETPKFSVTVLNIQDSAEQPIQDIDQLSELMIEGGEVPVVYAYGLYMNDELVGVYDAENMESIRDALNAKLNMYNAPDTVNVEFEDDIVISEGRFIEDVLTPADSVLEYINGSTDVESYYVVKKGDTISEICEDLGITRESFDEYNPLLSNGVHAGDVVTYHYSEPNLNVITYHYEVYDQVIERTTEYVESSRYEQYCEILLQKGSDGYENVTALVTETNGEETDRQIVSRTVLEEMVPRRFRVGTKENTYLDGDTTIIDRLGTFCWPLGDEDCYISSVFGYRSWDHSTHSAIDIAGIPRGTPIYAACDGKVTYSGWYAAYGELVIVDCGGGYECYYAHCSKRLVDVGDRVEKGDTIAEVGMTGSASGNHLHFEMRYNDKRIDPMMALGGPGGHRYNMA